MLLKTFEINKKQNEVFLIFMSAFWGWGFSESFCQHSKTQFTIYSLSKHSSFDLSHVGTSLSLSSLHVSKKFETRVY